MTRRDLLLRAMIAQPVLAPLRAAGQSARPPLCIFSKHMPFPEYDVLARESKAFGFEGIDLTVRPRGHVLPENAARDLPKAVRAMREQGLSVPMITTGLTKPDDPAAEPTLQTAGQLRIPFFKIGYSRYQPAGILEQLSEVKRNTTDLVEIAGKYGVTAGFHNHSGPYVGAAVWDIREMIRELDPQRIGYYFDPCHATIEGGSFGWRMSLDIALPRLKMVAIKDFYWKKIDGKWKVNWCPLGEGMVDWDGFFSTIAKARFSGPISLHVEYEPEDEHAAIAADLAFMRRMRDRHFG